MWNVFLYFTVGDETLASDVDVVSGGNGEKTDITAKNNRIQSLKKQIDIELKVREYYYFLCLYYSSSCILNTSVQVNHLSKNKDYRQLNNCQNHLLNILKFIH